MDKKKQISFESKEFKDLQKEWYQKLADTGFVDLEQHELHSRRYRSSGVKKYGKYSQEWNDSKAEYYNLAGKFLNEYRFRNRIQKVIWEYHTNGISTRDIADILNRTNVVKTNRTYVWEIVRDLRIKMKARYLVK